MRSVLRLGDWWGSKIPPLLGVAYLALLRGDGGDPASLVALHLALFLIACLGMGGIGYVVTEAFDVAEDRRAGKQNAWGGLRVPNRLALVAAISVAALLPWRWLPGGTTVAGLLALELGLFVAYAVPPLRLKERGLAGIVADALYAHVVPVLVAWVAFAPPMRSAQAAIRPMLLAAWMLPLGMRHLARHQYDDLDRDRLAGARTWAVGQGRDQAMGFIVGRLMAWEAVAALAALVSFAPDAPFLLAGFGLHAAWELHVVRHRWLAPVPSWRALTAVERHDLYGQRVLSAFVERWLGPLALVALIAHDGSAVWLAPLHLCVFGGPLWRWLHNVRNLPHPLRG